MILPSTSALLLATSAAVVDFAVSSSSRPQGSSGGSSKSSPPKPNSPKSSPFKSSPFDDDDDELINQVQAANKDAKKWIIPICTVFGVAFLLFIAFIVRSWLRFPRHPQWSTYDTHWRRAERLPLHKRLFERFRSARNNRPDQRPSITQRLLGRFRFGRKTQAPPPVSTTRPHRFGWFSSRNRQQSADTSRPTSVWADLATYAPPTAFIHPPPQVYHPFAPPPRFRTDAGDDRKLNVPPRQEDEKTKAQREEAKEQGCSAVVRAASPVSDDCARDFLTTTGTPEPRPTIGHNQNPVQTTNVVVDRKASTQQSSSRQPPFRQRSDRPIHHTTGGIHHFNSLSNSHRGFDSAGIAGFTSSGFDYSTGFSGCDASGSGFSGGSGCDSSGGGASGGGTSGCDSSGGGTSGGGTSGCDSGGGSSGF